MLKMTMLKPLGKILAKLDADKLFAEIRAIKNADTEEGKGKLGEVLIGACVKNLAAIADDLIELCALYKKITVEEAGEQNPITVIKEIIGEVGFSDFLSSASAGNTPK